MYEDTTTIELYEALQDYFKHLEKTGYLRYDVVFKLIVFMYIDEILHDYANFHITECDYDIIMNTLLCLYGICLLPYPQFIENAGVTNADYEYGALREAMIPWDILRQTEANSLRVIESGTTLTG